jgi:hypothetical protein
MKKYLLTLCLLCGLVLGLAGCEEWAAGSAAGMALATDAQNRFIETVNELNEETARLNGQIEAVNTISPDGIIKPEVIAAYESLKGREKDPVTWIALASVLGNMFVGGSAFEKRRNGNNK